MSGVDDQTKEFDDLTALGYDISDRLLGLGRAITDAFGLTIRGRGWLVLSWHAGRDSHAASCVSRSVRSSVTLIAPGLPALRPSTAEASSSGPALT